MGIVYTRKTIDPKAIRKPEPVSLERQMQRDPAVRAAVWFAQQAHKSHVLNKGTVKQPGYEVLGDNKGVTYTYLAGTGKHYKVRLTVTGVVQQVRTIR